MHLSDLDEAAKGSAAVPRCVQLTFHQRFENNVYAPSVRGIENFFEERRVMGDESVRDFGAECLD